MKQKKFKDLSIGDNVYFMRPSRDIENAMATETWTISKIIVPKNREHRAVFTFSFLEHNHEITINPNCNSVTIQPEFILVADESLLNNYKNQML